jgi:hypothetical protein
MSRLRLGVAAAAVCAVTLFMAAPAFAHEHRTVGGYNFVTGWLNEPTFSGVRNGVQLFLSDSNNQPVTDLGDTLTVQVIFGNQKTDPLPLKPAFGKTWGTPGEYDAALTPTRPGIYTFHYTGTVHGQPIDQSFTSSEKTFGVVEDTASIEFPVKDPSTGELATKVDRLDPRIQAAKLAAGSASDRASTATTVAIIGVVVGALGLIVGGIGVRSGIASRRRPNEPPELPTALPDGNLIGSRH